MHTYIKKLEEIKEELRRKITLIDAGENFGDDVDGFEEDADQTEQISTDLSVRELLEERLGKVEAALQKIETGLYGTCDLCGKDIEKNILDIDPESEWCQACKRAGSI